MKVWPSLSAVLVVSSLILGGTAVAQVLPSGNASPVMNARNPVQATLTGYVRKGKFSAGDTSKPIPYLYIELSKPIGKYVNNLTPSESGYRDIELVGGANGTIEQLEHLVGKKITVRGELPFKFDANAPSVVLPLVMLMNTHDPITVK